MNLSIFYMGVGRHSSGSGTGARVGVGVDVECGYL